ncbi:hypothetical protein TraAM80_10026 [Trypanosoma rangeli]|uniref:Uncharacterized protein n=1 Tax=Trypanosoma rangeli TaxID=5698 RepID=A0A3R7KK05_TRYRA|nr:uncharacterized protein TraAM80_10026 [Trypanosoma rangeli]RNE95988.1 hypothetical protein TraAM80_10026 [Trypanosoma rangeli]|eukprot:RNE95988.1 hypothetical protein TraAM80_10026 [Trypanosoma rangeli]
MNSSPGRLLRASELLSPPNRQIGPYLIDGVGECCVYFLALPVFKGMLAPWPAFLCVPPSPSFLFSSRRSAPPRAGLCVCARVLRRLERLCLAVCCWRAPSLRAVLRRRRRRCRCVGRRLLHGEWLEGLAGGRGGHGGRGNSGEVQQPQGGVCEGARAGPQEGEEETNARDGNGASGEEIRMQMKVVF